jgi:hypothetical protein
MVVTLPYVVNLGKEIKGLVPTAEIPKRRLGVDVTRHRFYRSATFHEW